MTGMLRIIMNASGLYELGVCPFSEVSDKLLNCMAKGRIPERAKSIIVALFPYKTPSEKGNLSMYAAVPDYHEIAGHMLSTASEALTNAFDGYSFVWFIDNSPIPEVFAAASAGLGMIGDNGLLIHPRYGSYCFIGCIVTDLEMPRTGGEITYCEHCGRCVKACPGGALSPGGEFCRDKCVSYISQKKGALSGEEVCLLRQGGLVWGCDTCQTVCPHNSDAAVTYIKPFLDRVNPNATINDLAHANDRAYLYRGRSVVERNIKILGEE